MTDKKQILTEHCYECGNCVQKCPVNAIELKRTMMGVCSPHIDLEKCIDCGICRKVCPSCEIIEKRIPINVYAAVSKSSQSIYSSSGGVFYELADLIIKSGGSVVGAGYDKNWTVSQQMVSDMHDLPKLQGSKYVKSDISDSYKITYDTLKENRLVLYSGTPCQIAGLKKYLENSGLKSTENLLTVDIICHGTPPAFIFQDYISFLSDKEGREIVSFSFRNKKFGHRLIGEYEVLKNSKIKKRRLYSSESSYFALFLKGYIYNDVCYTCSYACNERIGDITLGDFWGIKEEMPEFFAENSLSEETSVSAVMVNTEKGQRFFEKVKNHVISKPADYEKVISHNPQLNGPAYCDKNIRKDLLEAYKINGYEALENFYKQFYDYRKYSLRISCYIPAALKKTIKKILNLRR